MSKLQQQNSKRKEPQRHQIHLQQQYVPFENNISAVITINEYSTTYLHTYNNNIGTNIDESNTKTLSMSDTHSIGAYCDQSECFLNGLRIIESVIIGSINISRFTAGTSQSPPGPIAKKRGILKHGVVGALPIAVATTQTRSLPDGDSFFAQNRTVYKHEQKKDAKLDCFDFVYDKYDRIGDIWGDLIAISYILCLTINIFCESIVSCRYFMATFIILRLLLLSIATFAKNDHHLYKCVYDCDALLAIGIGTIYVYLNEFEYGPSAISMLILLLFSFQSIYLNGQQLQSLPPASPNQKAKN